MSIYEDKQLIVGIDIGKAVNYISFSDVNKKVEIRKREKSANNVYDFYSLLEYIEKISTEEGITREEVLIGIESTAHYWRNIYNFFESRGYDVVMVKNRNVKLKRLAKYGDRKKNDSTDSHCVGLVVKDEDFFEINKAERDVQTIRSLTRLKESLIKERVGKKNRLIKCLDVNNPVFFNVFKDIKSKSGIAVIKHFPSPWDVVGKTVQEVAAKIKEVNKSKILDLRLINEYILECNEIYKDIIILIDGERFEIAYYVEELERIEENIMIIEKTIVELIPEAIPAYKKITNIKGIGNETIISLLSEIGNINRFNNARSLQSFLGLGITGESSGYNKGEVNITKAGNKHGRKTLYDIVMNLIVHNREWRAVYCYYKTYNRDNKNLNKEMLIAVACKLLRVIYGMMKNNTEFDTEELLRDYDFSKCNRENFIREFKGKNNSHEISEEEVDKLFGRTGKQNRVTYN